MQNLRRLPIIVHGTLAGSPDCMPKDATYAATGRQIALQADVSVSTASRALGRHPSMSEEARKLTLGSRRTRASGNIKQTVDLI